MTPTTALTVDPHARGPRFPAIHRGRYEVDPELTEVVPAPDLLRRMTREAGLDLLRVGVGCWLPGQEPTAAKLEEREWFRGSTLTDTEDPLLYNWTHIDRVADFCASLGCEALLSVDHMPASLAHRGAPVQVPPEILAQFGKYTFPNGVRTMPPEDPDVFAAATLRVIDRFVARGTPVRYVELWNEPDLPLFYQGTFDQFWATYRAFAPAVKKHGYRVGGPACSWVLTDQASLWLYRFVSLAASERAPLDFYSWHLYRKAISDFTETASRIRGVLDGAGFPATESIIDEWGWVLGEPKFWGSVGNAAFTAACLMKFASIGISAQTQPTLVDPIRGWRRKLIGPLHGVTDKRGHPNPIFFMLKIFEQFQSTPWTVNVEGSENVLAGVDEAGHRISLILANPDPEPVLLEVAIIDGAQGTLRRLTQDSYRRRKGLSQAEPIDFSRASVSVALEPGSVAVVEADLRL